MEILNFLFLFNLVYIFYYTTFISKMIYFFIISMIISIVTERENLKNSNNYFAILITYILDTFSYIINLLIQSYLFKVFMNYLKKLNYFFVLGRNSLLNFLVNSTKNIFLLENNHFNNHCNKLEFKKNKKVFDNDEDMMDFLDDLDIKKTN